MKTRLLIVGAGHMGRFHAHKVRSLASEAELVAVCDLVAERAEALGGEVGARAVRDWRELAGRFDAAVVAVPTVNHFSVVEGLLDAGVDVLVEKPIAATLAEGEKLVALARERGRLLQVGHLEWFNAAMRSVLSRVRKPRFVEAHRLGPFPARATDVDVVRDLMIHDLDIIQRLLGEEPERVEAIGVPVLTQKADIANARLVFPGGCVANVTASRVSPTPMRKLRFFQADGYFSIDFLEHSVTMAWRAARTGEASDIRIERVEIDRSDALETQLRSFLTARREGKVREGAAEQALAALRTALRVVEAMPALEELEA